MSDRNCVIEMTTLAHAPTNRAKPNKNHVQLFMDGESGTWRLFAGSEENPYSGCADFSLETLKEFSARLVQVLADIESDPESYNAELRASWEFIG